MQTPEVSRIIKEALLNVYTNHKELGNRGLDNLQSNRFGETSLRADWEAEERVIETLRKHQMPIKIISEEHGTVELGDEFFGTLDGLDGTNQYVAFMNGYATAKYGTILSILEGDDPCYKDYIAVGIMMHPTGKLFTASRGEGVVVFDVASGETSRIQAPEKRSFGSASRILVDNYEHAEHYEFLQQYLRRIGQPFDNFNSTAAHYTALAGNEADILLECTRKGNIELPGGYALMSERGGVVLTLDRGSIGDKNYLEFHRGQNDYVALVHAANLDIAEGFIKKISAPNGI